MVWRTMLICLFLLISVGFTGAQQGERLPTKFRVYVQVSGDLKTEAESYLKRELRSLGDVEIMDLSGVYELKVINLESKYKSSGTKTGQVDFACMGIKRFNPFDLSSQLPKKHFDTVFDATSNLYYFPEMYVLRINEERTELKQVCQEIVAGFDTKVLEPDRSKR